MFIFVKLPSNLSRLKRMQIQVDMDIVEVDRDKKRYLGLLLAGDESEAMIDRYLGRGTLYVGYVCGLPVAVCVTTDEDDVTVEVKNLAVREDMRRRGLGRQMLGHVERMNPGKTIILGTGETPSTLRFYQSCGFRYTHRILGFFTENYPRPIVEEGVILCDMVYFMKKGRC